MNPIRKQQYILYFTLLQILLGFGIVIPILPHFLKDLGASSLEMGLVVTLWAAAQFLFSPVWGALSDRMGRRPLLLIGLTGYAVTFGVMIIAEQVWVVLLGRFLGGVLSAATIPTAQAYIADLTEGQERTKAMANMGAAMNLGFLAGPGLGGLLAGLGYRGTFAFSGVLALINMVLSFFTLPEPPKRAASAPVRRKGFSGLKAVSVALSGPEALLFWLAFGGTFGGSTMFSMLGFFLADRFQAGPELLAIAFTVEAIATLLMQWILIAPLSARFGEERAIGWALLAGSAGFFVLIFARSFAMVLAGLVVLGFGLAFIRPMVAAMVSRRTRMEQGMTMGIQTAFDALGRTLGPLWAGAVYLWTDWAPFASAIAIYLGFYVWTRIAWRTPHGTPNPAHTD